MNSYLKLIFLTLALAFVSLLHAQTGGAGKAHGTQILASFVCTKMDPKYLATTATSDIWKEYLAAAPFAAHLTIKGKKADSNFLFLRTKKHQG
ncbi:MAG: hypothetical protein R3C61_28780 [Bacteroidia bacterium]